MFENVTQELLGSPGDGTSIDFDEPFVLRFECDEDGWMLKINEDHKYQTFFHLFSPDLIETVQLQGQADISYVGFGASGTFCLFLTKISFIFNFLQTWLRHQMLGSI